MITKTSILACLLAVVARAAAADVLVFAAASVKDALDAQVASFKTAGGDRVVVSYGGSNALAKQLEAGAPADVFVSADRDWTDYVERKGLLRHGTRVDLLRNKLVLIAPSSNKASLRIAPVFDLKGALGNDKLAMANPDSVPAGKYGKAALESLGVWSGVERQVARAENVRAALVLVSRGEAAYGIVYATDAMADRGVRIVDTFPAASHPPIVYPAAVTMASKSPDAKAFLDYLQSPVARPVWERYGFAVAR
jgi:molybdate transport system substrate-binding protein